MKNEWKGTRIVVVVDGDHIVDEIWCGVFEVCRERDAQRCVCV